MLGFRNGRFLVFFGKRLNSEQMKMKRSVNKNHSRIGFFFSGVYRMNLFRICQILVTSKTLREIAASRKNRKYVLDINEVDNCTVNFAVTVVQEREKCSAAGGNIKFLKRTSVLTYGAHIAIVTISYFRHWT